MPDNAVNPKSAMTVGGQRVLVATTAMLTFYLSGA